MNRMRLVNVQAAFALIACLAVVAGCSRSPSRSTSVKIFAITPSVSFYLADRVTIHGRADNGLTVRKAVRVDQLDCRIGDVVPATVRGVSIHLPDGTCTSRPRENEVYWVGKRIS